MAPMLSTLTGLFINLERSLYRYRFVLLWAGHLVAGLVLLSATLRHDAPPYAIRDLLINFAGGPTRRGLGGEIAI